MPQLVQGRQRALYLKWRGDSTFYNARAACDPSLVNHLHYPAFQTFLPIASLPGGLRSVWFFEMANSDYQR